MPQWPVSANNAILVSGIPLEFEYEAGEANIWPGMGVTLDTTHKWEANMCTEGSDVICIVDVSMASLSGRGSWRRDSSIYGYTVTANAKAYAEGDQMKCISGPITVMLIIADGQDIDEGDKLRCHSNGMFGEFICGTTGDPCALVAEAMEPVVTVTVNTYIHCKLLI